MQYKFNLSGSVLAGGLVAWFGVPSVAMADTSYAYFTAPSLPTGSIYRIAGFSVDSIVGTSTDIATYNTFANAEAALNTALPTATWYAGVSAGSVSFASNISCDATCMAAPIYSVAGVLLANSTTDLLASNFVNYPPVILNGLSLANGNFTWTGSGANGSINSLYPLGSSNAAIASPVSNYGNNYFYNYVTALPSDTFPIFVISSEIGGTAVPEPSSALVLGAALAAMAGAGLRRRRRNATNV